MSEDLERLLVESVPKSCANLKNYLQQCFESDVHAKSFFEFLPKLCRILYGSKQSRGWLHLPLTKAEEDPLFDLINPDGILVRFLLSRNADTNFIYEMLPEYMPKRTQLRLEPASFQLLPAIYLSRVNLVHTTVPAVGASKSISSISKVNLIFNMIEYYIFYFTFALTLDDEEKISRTSSRVDPQMPFTVQIRRPGANLAQLGVPVAAPGSSADSMGASPQKAATASRSLVYGSYFNLYTQSLYYFLPPMVLPGSKDKEKDKDKESAAAGATATTSVRREKRNIFNDRLLDAVVSSTEKRNWQLAVSEFFIGTLGELWMCQNDPILDPTVNYYVQPGYDVSQCLTHLMAHLMATDISPFVLGGEKVPTHVPNESTGQMVPNQAGLARRSAYQYLRRELYGFLRMGLKFWPLDESFTLLVDLWMLWIAPWRFGRKEASAQAGGSEVIAEYWQPFILENLLFYTVIVEAFLPRLSQPSQATSTLLARNANAPLTLVRELRVVQRVLKVYRATNLTDILKVGEQLIMEPDNFTESSYHQLESRMSASGNNADGASGGGNSVASFLSFMVSVLQNQILQCEGRDFRYEAIFLHDGTGRVTLRMILSKLGNAVDIRQEKLAAIKEQNRVASTSFSNWGAFLAPVLSSIMSPPTANSPSNVQTSLERTVGSIRDIMKMIGEVFEIQEDMVASFERPVQSQGQDGAAAGVALTPAQLAALTPIDEEEGHLGMRRLLGSPSIASRAKYVLPPNLVRKPVDEIRGTGPRVEQLVMSYEVGWALKWSKVLENKLNQVWEPIVETVVARQVPVPKVMKRISLRWMASKQFLHPVGVLLAAYLMLWLLGSGLIFGGGNNHSQQRGTAGTRLSYNDPHFNQRHGSAAKIREAALAKTHAGGSSSSSSGRSSQSSHSNDGASNIYDPHVVEWEDPNFARRARQQSQNNRQRQKSYSGQQDEVHVVEFKGV